MARLAATLTLERYSKNLVLLERRVQPCRSFTRGLMEFLYTQNSQLANAVALADPDKRTLNYASNLGMGIISWTNAGKIASPGGSGWDFAFFEQTSQSELASKVPGVDLGIQIGAANTAATPSDRRMAQRIGHGTKLADGGSTLYESFDTGDDSNVAIHGASQAGQQFIPQHDHRIDTVGVKLFKTGAPPADCIVEIRPVTPGKGYTSGYGQICNTVLATGNIAAAGVGASPGAFVNCNLAVPVDLYAGHVYAICLFMAGGSGANCYNWRYNNAAGTSIYARAWGYNSGGNYYWIGQLSGYMTSADNITFSVPQPGVGKTMMFREYGMSIGEMEYGATILRPIATANPNSSFDIVRRFTNLSTAAITVQEVGIMMCMPITPVFVAPNGGAIGMCARDVVGPGVAVANTEILVVTYTPSITV